MKIKQICLLLLVSLISITCKETDTIYTPVETLTDPAVQPEVIYTFPASYGIGPFNNFSSTITIRFNKLMDASTLQHAVHFISSAGDLLPDTSSISVNQGDVASISPIRSNPNYPFLWRVGKSYTLRIDSRAKDVNGNSLNLPFELTFTPEPYFRVKTISPALGAINVNSTTLQLAFNASVDTSIQRQVVIAPPVSGLWRYVPLTGGLLDSSQLIFQSANGFTIGKTYSISIGSNAIDKHGNLMSGGFASSFNTIALAVTGTTPTNGSTNWSTTSRTISITMSDTLDTSTASAAFKINPVTAGIISYTSNLKVLNFTALNNFLPETVYTILIDSSIRSKTHAMIPQPYSFSFMTGPIVPPPPPQTFYVSSTSPPNGTTTFSPLAPVQIRFNIAFDTATIRNGFSITPPINGLIAFPSSTVLSFSPILSFSTATYYTITIGSSVTSTTGNPLGVPNTFSFATLPFEVTQSYPPIGGTHIPRTTSIQVVMSDFIDTSTVRNAFNISPSVNGALELNPYYNYFYFNPSVLQPYTLYTITISTALHSKAGIPLASPYILSFATGD
ncbi:MAG: Ig-like domain-containing protein [Bacteroidota bacterium]